MSVHLAECKLKEIDRRAIYRLAVTFQYVVPREGSSCRVVPGDGTETGS